MLLYFSFSRLFFPFPFPFSLFCLSFQVSILEKSIYFVCGQKQPTGVNPESCRNISWKLVVGGQSLEPNDERRIEMMSFLAVYLDYSKQSCAVHAEFHSPATLLRFLGLSLPLLDFLLSFLKL